VPNEDGAIGAVELKDPKTVYFNVPSSNTVSVLVIPLKLIVAPLTTRLFPDRDEFVPALMNLPVVVNVIDAALAAIGIKPTRNKAATGAANLLIHEHIAHPFVAKLPQCEGKGRRNRVKKRKT